MPGLGRRTFAPGEVLTATNVMGYLQDQAVMTFAGTAARGSAIGTAASEGMVSYLADSNLVEVYDGSAWKSFASTSGAVLQVQSFTYSTQVSTTSTTFVTTGLSGTITPTKTSSKILILANTAGSKSSDFWQTIYTIFRGTVAGTDLGAASSAGMSQMFVDGAGANRIWSNVALTYLDSPSTTSAQTYTLAMRTVNATAPAGAQQQNSQSSMILMEIAG